MKKKTKKQIDSAEELIKLVEEYIEKNNMY